MGPASSRRRRAGCFACAVVLATAMGGGCATQPLARVSIRPVADRSPVAEEVAPRDAWRLGETFVAAHPGTDLVVGRGGSMLPLYRDHTVLVVETVDMAQLAPGMTVVFIGDTGAPV